MTLGITEKPSLLTSLLKSQLQSSDPQPADGKGLFAGKLDKILEGAPEAEQTKAQSLAEALNLQMLQTTLALATDGETTSAPAIVSPQSPTLQALIKAYAENLSADSAAVVPVPPATTATETTPPALTAPSQLQEMAGGAPSRTYQPGNDKEGKWLDPIIAKASQRYGVEVGLIKAVIKAESNFNPNAVSHAGARGLMQLMPGTARSLGVTDSFDPEQNVMAGTRFLKDLLNRYNGDTDSALAAYNWGPGNVDKRPDRLPRETREYLVRVKQLFTSYTG